MATFTADPIITTVKTTVATVYPSGQVYVNRDNDVTWWASAVDGRGHVKVKTSLSGSVLNKVFVAEPIKISVSFSSIPRVGIIFNADPIVVYTGFSGYPVIIPVTRNWVAWSRIGEAKFALDRSNESGYRPMDFPGWAWRVLTLNSIAVVYGSGGICAMTPVQQPAPTFKFDNLGRIGILNPWCVAGDDGVHYFVTTKSELWRLTKQGPELLGFKEFLSTLTNPILVYDEWERELHINDGTKGFVFRDGLGGGYASLTGVIPNYVVGPVTIDPTPLSIMTDIFDLGHRGMKTTSFVEVGTDTTEDLFAALDFRYKKNEAWRTSKWVKLNREGVARIEIAAIEFRVRVKQTTYDHIRIDYINLRHRRTDRRYIRGPLYEQANRGEL